MELKKPPCEKRSSVKNLATDSNCFRNSYGLTFLLNVKVFSSLRTEGRFLPNICFHITNCLLPYVGSKSRLIEIVLGNIHVCLPVKSIWTARAFTPYGEKFQDIMKIFRPQS